MKYKKEISYLASLIRYFDYEILSNEEWNNLCQVDPSNKKELLEVFSVYKATEFDSLDISSQKLAKSSLYTALTTSDFNFEAVLDRVYLPFSPILNPELFFKTLWMALFNENLTNLR